MLETLQSADIDVVVDVRKLPGSRRSPQFDAEQLSLWLKEDSIGYMHATALCGRRPKQKDIDPGINTGWHNASFKNYADYSLTAEFRTGLEDLVTLAGSRHVAVMCGEPMPWRCHRLLIANNLAALGWRVTHLVSNSRPIPHVLGQWGARPVVHDDGLVTYPS